MHILVTDVPQFGRDVLFMPSDSAQGDGNVVETTPSKCFKMQPPNQQKKLFVNVKPASINTNRRKLSVMQLIFSDTAIHHLEFVHEYLAYENSKNKKCFDYFNEVMLFLKPEWKLKA